MQIGPEIFQTVRISKSLSNSLKGKLVAFLRENIKLFAWIAAHMPGIDPEFMSHWLSIFPNVHPMAQKRRKMSSEKAQRSSEGGNIFDLAVECCDG